MMTPTLGFEPRILSEQLPRDASFECLRGFETAAIPGYAMSAIKPFQKKIKMRTTTFHEPGIHVCVGAEKNKSEGGVI